MSETHLTARSSPYKFLIPFAHELRPLLGRTSGVSVERLGDRSDPFPLLFSVPEQRPTFWVCEVRLGELDRFRSEYWALHLA